MTIAKSKVRRDSHGLYVRTNGNVYRPVRSVWSYAIEHNGSLNSRIDGTSLAKEFDHVVARHWSRAPFATIKVGEVTETWHSHGSYLDYVGKTITSDLLWKPKS